MINNKTTIVFSQLVSFAAVLVLVSSVQAGPVLIDDFNDGNDSGWSHSVNPPPANGGPGIFDASSGEYRLATTNDVAPGGVGGVASIWDNSAAPMYSEGYLRAKVRVETEGTTVSLLLRTQAGPFRGYAFSATSVGADNPATVGAGEDFGIFGIQLLDQVTNPDLVFLSSSVAEFRAGEDWMMEAGAVGDQLSLKVWKVGDLEPAVPQMTATDNTFTAGEFGLTAEILSAVGSPVQTNAYFDDVYFTAIPEPATISLMALGILGLVVVRMRIRRNGM